jgi:hypothetical protein
LPVLAAAAAFAQPPAATRSAAPRVAPPNPARIAGRVLKQTGDPLRHSTVDLIGPERYTVAADANGLFAFDAVAPGTYSLIAQRFGYVSQKYGASGPLVRHCPNLDDVSYQGAHNNGGLDIVAQFRSCIESAPGLLLSLAAGQEIKNLSITLLQHGVISGKVFTQDGDAATGMVTGMQNVFDGGERRLKAVGSTITDPEGGYTVDDLPPGRYYIRAYSVPGAMAVSGGIMVYGGSQSPPANDATTFYPNETDPSKAMPVDVKPGEETKGVDIVLGRAATFTVRGTVALPAGSVPAAMYVRLLSQEPAALSAGGAMSSNVAPDGSFEIRNVPPGSYFATAPVGQDGASVLERREVTVVGNDVVDLSLAFVSGIAVSGAIGVEGPKPDTWPTVTLFQPGPANARPAAVDPGGSFKFPARVAPGQYEVRVSQQPGFYVKSIRYGGQDALHAPINLAAGDSPSLDIVLSSKVASVAGRVTDASDAPVGAALVLAWPRQPEIGGGVHPAATDQNGAFKLAGLGAGSYFVAAFEDLDPGLADAPDFLTRFQSEAAAATVEEGGRATANLKLIPPERVNAEIAKLP